MSHFSKEKPYPKNESTTAPVADKNPQILSVKKLFQQLFLHRFTPIWMLVLLVAAISFVTRTVLLLHTGAQFTWTPRNISGTYAIGLLYDLSMCAYLLVPFVLHLWFTNDKMYQPRYRWWVIIGFTALLSILLFTNIVPADFNKGLKKAVTGYVFFRFLIFVVLMWNSTAFRKKWRTAVLYIDFFLVTFLLLFNAVSEWFFWEEFSTRYNFIAVDYLVYTTEVIGNIKESYPLGWILFSVLAVTTGIFFLIRPFLKRSVYASSTLLSRTVLSCILLLLTAVSYFEVKSEWKDFSKNEYANELAGNGIFEFASAFWHNELDFYKFYQTLPDKEAFQIVRNDLSNAHSKFISNDAYSIERHISYPQPEQHYNIVLISVESLSADFMQAFGSDEHITPYLDSLANKSIFFTQLYSSGTRTVRGLEALSLSIPPTPGQSIVKRPNNENLFSLGNVLKSKGYTTQYIYGGYGYFDNMNYFFGHNGYDVIDREALRNEEIHYQNVWGVADEDLFTLAERTMDNNYAQGKPFFSHIMTVSNHRPFTYPDGRIDIPAQSQTREGAVKYTDYAINKFLKESSVKPWFNHTIFVIVADHCAGSAGSVQLPVTGYHIPMLIYAPAILQPRKVEELTAQIDIAPTLLGILKLNYTSKFFGDDVLNREKGKEKAFISTYEGLGFLSNNSLIIQSPVKKLKEYRPDFTTGTAEEEPVNDTLAKKAVAYYQVAAWLIKHKQYGQSPSGNAVSTARP